MLAGILFGGMLASGVYYGLLSLKRLSCLTYLKSHRQHCLQTDTARRNRTHLWIRRQQTCAKMYAGSMKTSPYTTYECQSRTTHLSIL